MSVVIDYSAAKHFVFSGAKNQTFRSEAKRKDCVSRDHPNSTQRDLRELEESRSLSGDRELVHAGSPGLCGHFDCGGTGSSESDCRCKHTET